MCIRDSVGFSRGCNAGAATGQAPYLLFLNPAVLFQKDEIDTMFNVIKMAKDPSSETMLGKLLTIFGSSNSVHRLRDKAVGRAELERHFVGVPCTHAR